MNQMLSSSTTSSTATKQQDWASLARIAFGFVFIYGMFEGSARLLLRLGITRPTSFFVTSALVIVTALAVERWLFKQAWRSTWRSLGLGRPVWGAVGMAVIISAVMLAGYPLLTAVTGAHFVLPDNWALMFLGIFVMNGIAEEMMVRGYLFRRLHSGRSFWQAVAWVMLVHGAAHIPILLEVGLLVGATAIFTALASGIPFAYLFERGGNTLWAPALVHFAADTVIVFATPAALASPAMQMATALWLLIVAGVPYLAFLWGRQSWHSASPPNPLF